VISIDVDALLATQKTVSPFAGVTGVTGVTVSTAPSNDAGVRPLAAVTPPQPPRCDRCDTQDAEDAPSISVTPGTPGHIPGCDRGNTPEGVDIAQVPNAVTPVTPVTPQKEPREGVSQGEVAGAPPQQAHIPPLPPPPPGRLAGAPFRPGHQVWLYRGDDHTPRFAAPVTIVQMRTLWPGEQDIGWCNAAGEVTWHNARLAVAVETQESERRPQDNRAYCAAASVAGRCGA
jgi:hypothetical protein